MTTAKTLGLAALAVPLVAFAFVMAVPAWDPFIMALTFHFYVVSFTALGAAIACAVIMASARTLQQTRLLFLGLAFFALAGIFAVHGLTTPGFLTDEYYGTVGVSAWLSVAAASLFVALSVVGLPASVEHAIERNGRAIFALAALGVFGYIGLSLSVGAWLDWVPIRNRAVQYAVGLPGLALIAFAIWRYYQAYAFARLPSQLAMVATLAFLMEAQVMILWGRSWHISWWFYHGLFAIAIGALFVGWAVEVKRSGTLRAIADALSMRDALAQLNRGLDARILELVDAIEIKDQDTFGHVRRVSGHALAIGRRLSLSGDDLRSLVLAAEMHDVGKISVPDSILMKPGPLTNEEFTVVKQHTTAGHEIALRVEALRELADVIRSHHERLDGSGYPRGLKGEEIPLFSRIIAVADTYDAMTSKRPYRAPLSHVEAMGEIMRLKGKELDARCVDALASVFAEPGSRSAPEELAA